MTTFSKKLGLLLIAAGLAPSAFAHKENFMLQYTMKAVAKDVLLVADPTKKPNPADVLDGAILTAIVRTRSAASLIQSAIDRKGGVENGKIVLGEMTPGGLDETPTGTPQTPEKFKEMIVLFETYLQKTKAKLAECETELKTQFAQKNPELRDFRPLKAKLTDLDAIETEAHKIFRPQTEE